MLSILLIWSKFDILSRCVAENSIGEAESEGAHPLEVFCKYSEDFFGVLIVYIFQTLLLWR